MSEILLVEDYEPDAGLLLRQFRRHHIINPVHLVTDGEAALNFVFARCEFATRLDGPLPAAIIMDIRLPKLDAWEVMRELRQATRTRDLPVIIMSGSLFKQELDYAAFYSATACLAKPIHISTLREVLENCGVELSTTHELAA